MVSTEAAGDCCNGATQTYLDESYRRAPQNGGFYLFAAVSLEAQHEENARSELRKALPGKMERFHWHTDSDRQHKRALEALTLIADSLDIVVFAQSGVPPDRQERNRQHALWNVVPTLADRCAHNLTFEGREKSQDQIDSKTLSSISKSNAGGQRFSYGFSRPLDEPLLWLPDMVLGATGLMLTDRTSKWWAMLTVEPELIDVSAKL